MIQRYLHQISCTTNTNTNNICTNNLTSTIHQHQYYAKKGLALRTPPLLVPAGVRVPLQKRLVTNIVACWSQIQRLVIGHWFDLVKFRPAPSRGRSQGSGTCRPARPRRRPAPYLPTPSTLTTLPGPGARWWRALRGRAWCGTRGAAAAGSGAGSSRSCRHQPSS